HIDFERKKYFEQCRKSLRYEIFILRIYLLNLQILLMINLHRRKVMKANKLVVAGLSLALSLSMVACNNKENTTDNNTNTTTEQNTADTTNNATNDYVERYSRFYGDNIGDLSMYSIYETPDTI